MPGTSTPAPSGHNKVIEAARIQLARTINVDVDLVSVETVEAVWWPDNCLGLPRPREICERGRTRGFRIVLTAGKYRFIYRTDLAGENVRLEDLTTDQG